MRAMLPGQRVVITWCTRCQKKIENTGSGNLILRAWCEDCLPTANSVLRKDTWILTDDDIAMLRALPYPIDPR